MRIEQQKIDKNMHYPVSEEQQLIEEKNIQLLGEFIRCYREHYQYCLLLSYTENAMESRVFKSDLLVSRIPADTIRLLALSFAKEHSINLINISYPNNSACCLAFTWIEKDNSRSFFMLHLCFLQFLSLEPLFKNNCYQNLSDTLQRSYPLEFIYRLLYGCENPNHLDTSAELLNSLYKMDSSKIKQIMVQFWDERGAEKILKSLEQHDWEKMSHAIRKSRILKPSLFTVNNLDCINRAWLFLKRLLHPPGLWIAFMGPDGSGKSSVIEELHDSLDNIMPCHRMFHLRPILGYKLPESRKLLAATPHKQKPRSRMMSLIKLIYFVFDYGIGYFYLVYPMMVRGGFVSFDRYYHDLYIDPVRFRFSASPFWVNVIEKLIPKPDLMIFLDVPSEILQQRKQEVTPEESARQREAYLKLANRLPQGRVVDASQNIDQVVRDIENYIMEFMTKRMVHRVK